MRTVNVHTTSYHIYAYDETRLSMVVYNHTLANKVNKLLDQYKDVRIVKGEEPVFRLSRKQFEDLRQMQAFKHIVL